MSTEPLSLDEKLAKIRSPNLQSQKQTSLVLAAVDETLKETSSDSSPSAYFSAILALLDQAATGSNVNKETLTSLVYLLDIITPFAPQGLLQSEFSKVILLLAPILLEPEADAPLVRPSIGCLETLLISQNARAWQMGIDQVGPRRTMAGLLMLSLDPRPKVRKRAQEAVKRVLKSHPAQSHSPSLDHPAADMCGETAMKSLEENAARVSESRKQSTEAHDPSLIHALQLARAVASATGGWPSSRIEELCELLLNIARARNQHMIVVVFEIFEMIFEGMVDEVASTKLPRLLEIISELRPSMNDTQLLPPWIAIVSRAYDVSAQIEPEDTFQKLPELFEMIGQFMESPSENIRVSASECLISFLVNCIPEQVIVDPSVYDEKTLEKLAKVAESLLSVKYQGAWMDTFTFFGAMFDTLKWRSYPVMVNIARNVGDIRSNDSFMGKKQADEVLGKAILAMGPKAMLEILPLNLAKPSRDQPGRAWMLPLLRDYVSNTNLEHFKTEFIPLSTAVFKRVEDDGEKKSMETKIYETVFHQIWSLLPGYCDLPIDLVSAFDQSFAELLATILYERPSLRLDVCRALKNLIESNKPIAQIDGEDEEDLLLQSRVSRAQAQENLEHMSTFASNMLAVLFNVYTQTMPQSRGPILQTINAFVAITPQAELIETFNRVCQMLSTALAEAPAEKKKQDQQDQMPSTAQTLMDLVITMSVHLPRESFATLFEIAATIIKQDTDTQLQKKAYKLIPRLADSVTGKAALKERNAEVQHLLLANAEKVTAPSRRDRLAAISALIPFIPDDNLHFIPAILSEVVIACKEHNEKARMIAFDLLVQLAARMDESKGATIQNNKVPGLPADAPSVQASVDEYCTMLSAGLAGGTPHMISATITAISRVLYEFWKSMSEQTLFDMVETMDLFLTSNNREIVKSCLGFVKISVISLPINLMLPRLTTLIPNLMRWSHEHKGHFKSKVKHMLERMVRRFGFEVVNNNTPEDDRKLIASIRKAKDRAKRKKAEAKNAENEGSDEDEDGNDKFDNAYDEALYSSSESEDEPDEEVKIMKKGNKKGGRDAYIVEDEDEPLDLLDRKALANISSTKPTKARQRQRTKARTDQDGKLIFGGDDAGESMEVDEAPAGEESGVGAYVAALQGGNIARRGRGGKLKFSNRRDKDNDDNEMDLDETDVKALAAAAAAAGNERGGRGRGRGGRGGAQMGRGMFAHGGGRGGRGDGGGRGFGGGGRGDGGGRGFGGGGRGGGGRGGSGRGSGPPGGRGGKGHIANGRRGLGEDKQRGPPRGRVMKSPRAARGGRR